MTILNAASAVAKASGEKSLRERQVSRSDKGTDVEAVAATLAVYPVILSGGSGTRLWPLSRAMYPKQFVKMGGADSVSLLNQSLSRLTPQAGFKAPTLLCSNDHRFLVQEELAAAKIEPLAIILEPVSRNTAAAIAVAAEKIAKHDPDGIMVVMPSDHVFADDAAFLSAVKQAVKVAASGKIVLFGIVPTKPETGYGYIRQGVPLDEFADAFEVAAFVEKPDQKTAERYLASGEFFWNSGIFVLHAKSFLKDLAAANGRVAEAARHALAEAKEDLGFLRLDRDAYSASPNVSVDTAVLETSVQKVMLPLNVGWSDLGSWGSLWDNATHDSDENATHGDAVLEDTTGCYVHSDGALVSTIGLKDLVIVNTRDALLVADRSRTQEVSKIVAQLKLTGRKEQEKHVRSYRPWGFFESMSIASRFQVKLLHVKPGGRLSVQMHFHRSEHWIVVQGTAKVVIGDEERLVRENESVYISSTQWHRLENPGKVPLELIEVQTGAYFGEDDIVRSEDVYNRTADETK